MFEKLRTLWRSEQEPDRDLEKAHRAVDEQMNRAVRQRSKAQAVSVYLSRSRQENHYAPRLRAAFELERKPS